MVADVEKPPRPDSAAMPIIVMADAFTAISGYHKIKSLTSNVFRKYQMSIFSKLAIIALPVFFLAACDTSVTPSYQTSPQNTIALQGIAASGKRTNVHAFAVAEGVNTSPSCRLAGPIDVGGGQTAEQALKDAITAELLAAGVYSANGTPLTITLTQMEVNTMSGYWVLGAKVQSSKLPQGFTVESRYDYKTSFSAASACPNAAIAFNRAASAFINKIVTNPNFRGAL